MNFSSYYDWVLVISTEPQLDGVEEALFWPCWSSYFSSPQMQVVWYLEIQSLALWRSCTFQVLLWEELTWKPTELCRSWGGRATAALVPRGTDLWGGRWGEWEIEAPGQQMRSQRKLQNSSQLPCSRNQREPHGILCFQWSQLYGLNICVSPCGYPSPQCDDIRRWIFGK